MRLRYETGVATLIQFIITIALSFINGLTSIIGGCTGGATSASCVSNVLVTLILIILIAFVFGFFSILGYAAQERRSSRLAKILIGLEAFSALIYLFDAQHTLSTIGRLINLVLFLVAAWVIWLAWRLAMAKGGRIVNSRTRRRRASSR